MTIADNERHPLCVILNAITLLTRNEFKRFFGCKRTPLQLSLCNQPGGWLLLHGPRGVFAHDDDPV